MTNCPVTGKQAGFKTGTGEVVNAACAGTSIQAAGILRIKATCYQLRKNPKTTSGNGARITR